MSEWRGLHNQDWHRPETENDYAWCYRCVEECDGPKPVLMCQCCLAAEVEGLADALHESEMAREELRKALAERDQKIEEALARLQWAGCKVRGCSNPSCATVHEVQAILRSES